MADYINRDALLKELMLDPIGRMLMKRYNLDGFIKGQPAAEVEQVKHGKWVHDGYDIPHGVDWMHCTNCGNKEPNVPAAMTNYCPDCGAKMYGEGK